MSLVIDHLAFRTIDRKGAVKFLCDALGYREATQFKLDFQNEEKDEATCSVLESTDRTNPELLLPWTYMVEAVGVTQRYVLSPEIFISEGSPGSIVDTWARSHGGANLHHIALQVPKYSTVKQEMEKWKQNGWCEDFTSDEPFHCDDMSQVFTQPSSVLGVIFELIKRKKAGFCQESVIKLMESTENF